MYIHMAYHRLTVLISAICLILAKRFQPAPVFDDKLHQVLHVGLACRRIHAGKFQALSAANPRMTDYGSSFLKELLADLVVQQISLGI